MKTGFECAILCLVFLCACGPDPEPPPTGGGTTKVTCAPLVMTEGASPPVLFFHPENDTYGVNSFYLWQVDRDTTTTPTSYRFQDTGGLVMDWVPGKNWDIPATTWSAARLGLDGHDPYKFNADDPFVLGYLPSTPPPSWTTKSGAINEGTCPDGNVDIGGLPKCVGKNQRDPAAPTSLDPQKAYVVRMMMLIPLGGVGGYDNAVISCFQKIVDE